MFILQMIVNDVIEILFPGKYKTIEMRFIKAH